MDEQRTTPEPEIRDRRRGIVKVVVGLVLVVLFVVFVTQNANEVEVNLVFVEASIPLIWVFLGCALIGGIVALLLGRPGRRASRKYIRELERRLGDRD
ncbi:MAG TPA: LapA family protein [Actinomycetota bacterium]|nr:LapA family protein [Actinomycetota bacterium]